ncbi:OsmC family protein [Pseudomonas sp. NPDC008258]|uniref:OsmC family protein n=1 Tax=Pseudomonas sp. NPDC008258 TaxID=3364418 RepID=UPI0036F064BD
MKEHTYSVTVNWVGNSGEGTTHYTSYQRDFDITAGNKRPIAGSADPAFRGDSSRWNPEDLLVASLSACHKLWYLHLCAVNDVNVLEYVDQPLGFMSEGDNQRKGHFRQVTLCPRVVVASGSDIDLAMRLHEQAHHECFIANSVNFPVLCDAVVEHQR